MFNFICSRVITYLEPILDVKGFIDYIDTNVKNYKNLFEFVQNLKLPT